MAVTGLAELTDTIPVIIEEAHFTEQFNAVMRGLVWNVAAGKGSTTNIPYFGDLAAARLTEKVDMINSETPVDTNVQITPYECGLKVIITEDLIEDDQEDMKRVVGKLMGDAYERKRDGDLLAQMDDAASSLCGSANPLTMGHIAAGRATLLGNTAAGGRAPFPYVVVLHPFHELDIVDVVTPVVPTASTSSSYSGQLAEDILRNYSTSRLFGMPIVIDGNLAFTAVSVKGGMFASGRGGGIIYVSKREPTIVPDVDPSLRAVELNYVGRYGVGEYLSGWIVEIWADATAPA